MNAEERVHSHRRTNDVILQWRNAERAGSAAKNESRYARAGTAEWLPSASQAKMSRRHQLDADALPDLGGERAPGFEGRA